MTSTPNQNSGNKEKPCPPALSNLDKAIRRAKRIYWTALTPSSVRCIPIIFRLLFNVPKPGDLVTPDGKTNIRGIINHPATQGFSESSSEKSITKIIFQTWKTKETFPVNYTLWSETFPHHNPDYQHVIWDDNDNRSFIKNLFPWFMETYEKYPREIFRADIIRLFFLYHFGGIYADMDTECLCSLDSLLENKTLLLARMGHDKSFEHSIPNAMMASCPRHLFWGLAISMAIERIGQISPQDLRTAKPEFLTGPILIKDAHDFFASHSVNEVRAKVNRIIGRYMDANAMVGTPVTLLSNEDWYPIDWTNGIHRMLRAQLIKKKLMLSQSRLKSLFPKASLVTYWGHSW